MTDDTFEGFSWFLDKFQVIVDNSLFVIAGAALSILVGALAFYLDKPRYRSEAILPVSANVRAAFKSDAFLSNVATDSVLLAEASGDVTRAVEQARSLIQPPVEAEKGGHLFVVSVIEHSPERGQAILQSVVRQILRGSKPIGTDRESRVFQISELEKSLPEFERLYSQLEQSITTIGNGAEGERLARALTILYGDIADKKLRLTSLKQSLDGASSSDIVVPPNLGVPMGGRSKLLFGTIALIFAATIGLIFVKDFFARAQQFPEIRSKLDRLMAFGRSRNLKIPELVSEEMDPQSADRRGKQTA